MYSLFIKRLIDILLAAILLVLTFPLMGLAVLLIIIDGHDNPFFLQKRLGLHGKEFTIYKLRTMKPPPLSAVPIHFKPNASILTAIARFLRKSGLDELPQLFNILKGDMSLIGPRPHALEYAAHYASIHPHYHDRYRVRPGLACLVEVTVLHHMTETPQHIKTRIKCDLYYVNHQSLMLDYKIFVKLMCCVVKAIHFTLPEFRLKPPIKTQIISFPHPRNGLSTENAVTLRQ